MRPTSFSIESDLSATCTNPGLSLSWHLVYNDWQKLPIAGASPSPVCGTSLPSEAAMKSARPESHPVASPSRDAKSVKAGETRAERLARIKQEIEAGTYDSDEKLEKAIDRMLGVLMD